MQETNRFRTCIGHVMTCRGTMLYDNLSYKSLRKWNDLQIHENNFGQWQEPFWLSLEPVHAT
jgi:hypothetical protein